MSLFIYPPLTVSTSGGATEAKQDTIITELQQIEADIESGNTTLTSIDGKDFATETTLGSLNTKVTKADTDNVTVTSSALPTGAATEATLSSINGKDFATETTLSSINSKDFATETTLSSVDTKLSSQATAANQTTANNSLANIEADIDALNARVAGNLVPETFDYLEMSYVASGNGTGEIETVTYKTGGAAGTTVATLTLGYDANDRLTSVTRS